jgi:hypothetical protein
VLDTRLVVIISEIFALRHCWDCRRIRARACLEPLVYHCPSRQGCHDFTPALSTPLSYKAGVLGTAAINVLLHNHGIVATYQHDMPSLSSIIVYYCIFGVTVPASIDDPHQYH